MSDGGKGDPNLWCFRIENPVTLTRDVSCANWQFLCRDKSKHFTRRRGEATMLVTRTQQKEPP
jgi:hypothetical protein